MTAEHDDHLADAVALVIAAGGDDREGFGAVARNCDQGAVTVVLAKLLAELAADNAAGHGACGEPECFRAWASEAITRP